MVMGAFAWAPASVVVGPRSDAGWHLGAAPEPSGSATGRVARRAAERRERFERYIRQTLGTAWTWVGCEQPPGREIKCGAIAKALCWRQSFAVDEIVSLRGGQSLAGESWVRTRLGYFKPAADASAGGVDMHGQPIEGEVHLPAAWQAAGG